MSSNIIPTDVHLQTYIHQYLNHDTQNLQRIFKQLEKYQPPSYQHQQIRNVQMLSKRKKIPYSQKHSSNFLIKSSQILMKNLRDRGIKSNPQNQQIGIKIYHQIKEKIDKPLKINSKVDLNEQSPIVRQLSRYYINKKFYQNNIDDANINMDQQFDPEMKEFIIRRKSLLADIRAKKNTQSTLTSNKFNNVKSKFRMSEPQIVSNYNSQATIKAKNIIELCDDYHHHLSLPKQCTINHYSTLSRKLSDDGMDQLERDIINKIKKQKSNVIDKYDHSYMKMMSMKAQKKCKLNKYQKDLMQDQIKMRYLLNFTNKKTSK